MLALAGTFAIPQSVGGLLAAIAAVITVYWQTPDINYSLITAGVCLALYLLGFQDVRYDPAPEKKLSIHEIIATVITIGFMVQMSLLILQNPSSWLTSAAIGAIAAAIPPWAQSLAPVFNLSLVTNAIRKEAVRHSVA
jgi:UDP-N-acetylmuramyl pentapeptide phosphotransferase/UDP-N-acetylglucosamine-1-phosphate transferase